MDERIQQTSNVEMRISDDKRLDSVMLPIIICLFVAVLYMFFIFVGSDELPTETAASLALLISVGLIFQQAKQGIMKYDIILDKKHDTYRITATRYFVIRQEYTGRLSRLRIGIKTIHFNNGDDEDDYTCGVCFHASGEEFYLSIGNLEAAKAELARINQFLTK